MFVKYLIRRLMNQADCRKMPKNVEIYSIYATRTFAKNEKNNAIAQKKMRKAVDRSLKMRYTNLTSERYGSTDP